MGETPYDPENEERIALLSKKYSEGGLSKADADRLQILQGIIIERYPRVRPEDFEHLRELERRSAEAVERVEKIMKKLKLDIKDD